MALVSALFLLLFLDFSVTDVLWVILIPVLYVVCFGNCQDQSNANAGKVSRLADFQNFLTDYVTESVTNRDDEVFFVEKELAAPKANESEMAATQEKYWLNIQEQLAVYGYNSLITQLCLKFVQQLAT